MTTDTQEASIQILNEMWILHGDSPGKNIGVGCHALLQGIFLTQELNPGLQHCSQVLYHLIHQGSPHRDVEK